MSVTRTPSVYNAYPVHTSSICMLSNARLGLPSTIALRPSRAPTGPDFTSSIAAETLVRAVAAPPDTLQQPLITHRSACQLGVRLAHPPARLGPPGLSERGRNALQPVGIGHAAAGERLLRLGGRRQFVIDQGRAGSAQPLDRRDQGPALFERGRDDLRIRGEMLFEEAVAQLRPEPRLLRPAGFESEIGFDVEAQYSRSSSGVTTWHKNAPLPQR